MGKDESRIRAAEVTFVMYLAEHTLFDHKRNQHILRETGARTVLVQISSCGSRWVQRVSRLGRHRLPQTVVKNQPAGKSNTVRPLQRLQDCPIENGTGHEASVLECVMMIMMMRRRRRTDD